MPDLDQYQSAMLVKISDANSTAIVTNNVVGDEQGLVVRTIPASGLIQPTSEMPDSTGLFAPLQDNPVDYESFSISKTSPGSVYGLLGFNNNLVPGFIQLHNRVTPPVSGNIPVNILFVGPQNNFYLDGGKFGMYFSSGIVWAHSTTPTVYTPDTLNSGNVWVNLFYK